MREHGYGKIINIASMASEVGMPRIVAYGSSKGGVRQITQGLAVEWARVGIRVNGIEPGWFRTELTEPLFHDEAWVAKITRSEEHTSELQSLMRISYAVFCLKKKNTNENQVT